MQPSAEIYFARGLCIIADDDGGGGGGGDEYRGRARKELFASPIRSKFLSRVLQSVYFDSYGIDFAT